MNRTVEYEKLSAVNKPFENEYKEAFDTFLKKGWYILGEEVRNFESEFASFTGTKYDGVTSFV